MTRIFKYQLPTRGTITVSMPRGARLLTVQRQYEQLVLWAVVDDKAPLQTREFLVALTGPTYKDLKPSWPYVGTVQFEDGNYVAHGFEIAP